MFLEMYMVSKAQAGSAELFPFLLDIFTGDSTYIADTITSA